jgi:hypothetical protein
MAPWPTLIGLHQSDTKLPVGFKQTQILPGKGGLARAVLPIIERILPL